jgi:hypothetical protein
MVDRMLRVGGDAPKRHRVRRAIAVLALAALPLTLPDARADTDSAAALRAMNTAMRDRLASSPFGRPLVVESIESPGALRGDVHAVIDQPFARLSGALQDAAHWCEILILLPNVKGCRASVAGPAPSAEATLTMSLGRSETPVEFAYAVKVADTTFLDVRLSAAEGPFGTTDYRIAFQATPLDAQRTIVHLTYAHGYGTRARLAMQTYFSTLGRGKVGFTVASRRAGGEPIYVGDLRGGIERNAMRYYFAIDAYLASLSAPSAERLERRLRLWLAETEKYPLQLREEAGYLERKRGDLRRQQAEHARRS